MLWIKFSRKTEARATEAVIYCMARACTQGNIDTRVTTLARISHLDPQNSSTTVVLDPPHPPRISLAAINRRK